MTDHSVVRLAGRHLDPTEGVMQIGHVVTQTDIGALNTVLHHVAQTTAPVRTNDIDYNLIVTVRVYGGGSLEEAAQSLKNYSSTFDLPGDREVEIINVRTW